MVTPYRRQNVKLANVSVMGTIYPLGTFPLCERAMILARDSQNINKDLHMEEVLESDCIVNNLNNGSC